MTQQNNTMMMRRLAAVLAVGLCVLMLAGCGNKQEAAASESPETRVVPVHAIAVERGALAITKQYTGSLEGQEQANVVSKISERVVEVRAHVGDQVTAGQVVLVLDKSGAQSQYYQAQAALTNAEKTLERMKPLFKEGAISQQQLDGVQTQYDVAKANFDAARSAVELTVPITGVVTAVNVSIGDLCVPGAVLMTAANVGSMKVTFNLNEEDAASLALGQTVEVFSETRPDVRVQGRITQLSKSADVKSRSFEIKALFPNTSGTWFRPGMFCKVNLKLAPKTSILLVPVAAVQSDGITSKVFLVQNGRAVQRTVTVGISDGERIEILQGVAERDSVITMGANNLKEGTTVNIVGR